MPIVKKSIYNPNCFANKSGKIPNAINAKMMNTQPQPNNVTVKAYFML